MKLKTKILIIPVCIVVIEFLFFGSVFTRLLISHLEKSQIKESVKLIESQKALLSSSLSLLTSTQLPSDALIALDVDIDDIAKDVLRQVHTLGVDDAYFAALNGDILYPEESQTTEGLSSILEMTSLSKNDIRVGLLEGKMIGFAPIIDGNAPKGFLIVTVDISPELRNSAIVAL